VKDLFPDLFAERGVQELRMKELSKKASEKLVRQVLGETTSDELVSHIVTTSAGNAFYLEELIRSVSVSWVGLPKGRGPRASLGPMAVPETVLTMVQARLEALEPEARRVLRASSIFGQTFWRGGVIALLASEDSDAHVTAWLDELCERELVTRRDQTKFRGEQEYMFRHAFVAEAAYSMLTDKDRAVGHKLAAQWLEHIGESEAVVLAEHLERGGERKRAVTFYRRAAAQALEGNDLAACLARADAGLACGADGEVLGRLLLRKAEAHRWRGENVLAKECAEASIGLLPRGGRRWFLAAGEAVEASARLGDSSALHRAVDEVCDVSSTGHLSTPHLVALTRAACVLMQAGNYPSADDLLRTIDAAYERARRDTADPLASGHVQRTRAYRAHVSGDAASALSLYNRAITSFEEAGDMRAACRQLVSAAAACIELGAYADAERSLSGALASAERMGLSGVVASAWHHSAMLLARQGHLAGALARVDAALAAFIAQGDRRMEAMSHVYRAFFLTADGQLAAAIAAAEAARARGVGSPIRAFASAVVARVRLREKRADLAEAPAREAMRLLDTLGGVEEGESWLRLTYAETLDAIGDREGARDAIRTARVRILERVATTHDPAWKKSFLETVHENARTLELATAWRVL
jgi:predicted ATPase